MAQATLVGSCLAGLLISFMKPESRVVKLSNVSSWLIASSCIVLLGGPAGRADNWPQWRGPTNDGICKETGLPVKWGPGDNIAWKLPLPGMGGSTPIVWNDHIFFTSADGKDIVLVCVSTQGKELWK